MALERASYTWLLRYNKPFFNGHHVVTSRTVDMVASKANTWVWLEQSYVQILVVVATIQMRTLKTDVEKGSMWTAIGHGSVSPKMRSKEGSERGILMYTHNMYSVKSKGKQVNILVLSVGDCLIFFGCQTYVVTQTSSNTSQVVLERVFSSLLLHRDDPGISSTGDRVQMKVKSSRSCYFLGASFVVLENLSERCSISHLSVL